MCEVENLKVLIKHAMKGNQQCYEFVSELFDKGKKSNRPKGGYHYRHAGLASAIANLFEAGKLRLWRGQSATMKEEIQERCNGQIQRPRHHTAEGQALAHGTG